MAWPSSIKGALQNQLYAILCKALDERRGGIDAKNAECSSVTKDPWRVVRGVQDTSLQCKGPLTA